MDLIKEYIFCYLLIITISSNRIFIYFKSFFYFYILSNTRINDVISNRATIYLEIEKRPSK